ncbi:phage portal protein [Leifsonia sp. TF02-11]|uniref:phage portal protein n=1 Tax=Leifsonia sp. TF02-11 TaxID=2815212 RepID=UPI001AA0D290|nr:phage portal protein [Leifsonia sp. TF02-11]MBO1739676.1 phage portal protein [Leifsonia sp. TF02-11]
MPLPDSEKVWPPAQLTHALDAMARYDAWYTNDVDALGYLYSVTQLNQSTSFWGQVRRWFWGTPTPQGSAQRPNKMHVAVASSIARMAANVVFSQMPDVRFGDNDDHDEDDKGLTAEGKTAATKRVGEILDDRAHSVLLEAGELRFAHGGSFVKVAWDKDVSEDGPYLVAVAADAAVPKFRGRRLVNVIFWSDLAPLEGSKNTYRLLEMHEKGRIEYGLYEATSSKDLGMRVPLDTHPDTAYLAPLVDADSAIPTGSKKLTAAYLPWARPNGKLRKDPGARDLGKSGLDGVEDLLDQIDEAYTSWMRDIRLGKARIVIPKGLIETGAPGQGGTFDADREIFVETGEMVGSMNPQANGGKGAVESFITMFQPNIRWQEHMQTVTHLLAKVYEECGFSPQSFGDAGETAVTATEVTARENLTTLTRQASIMYCRPELRDLYAALMDVDQFAFKGPGRGDALPDVEWPDADTIDPKVVADTILSLVNAEAISLFERVAALHPDWDDEQIDTEVTRIREDYSMLPENKPGFLWAATAANGSDTGGVDANSYGVKGANTEGIIPPQQPTPDAAPQPTAAPAPRPGPPKGR